MGKGGNNNPSSTSTKTKRPSFFKVLVGDFTNQLRIPRAFLNHFNGKLPEASILKSPTGRYWVVEMKKVEKDLFFGDGWERFVKEHSLEFGDFLVFRYSGKCKFNVKIYARNACEKEMVPPLSKKTNVEPNSHKRKQKVDVAIEKCTKFPRFSGKDGGVEEKMKKAIWNKTMTYASVKRKRLDGQIERKAVLDQYDSGFSCFTVACSRCRSHYMTLPKMVVEENGLMNKASLQLSDPHGRLWPVTVTHRIDGRVNLRGWGEFWKGNNLEVGDTCQFKFNEGLGNVVYMEIFRAKKLVKLINHCLKPSRRLTCSPNEDASQATESREGSDTVRIVDVSLIHPKAELMMEVIDENEGQQISKMKRLTPRSRLRYSLRSFERNITRPTFDSHSRCTTQVEFSPKRDRNSTQKAEVFSPCQATRSTESDGYDSALQEEFNVKTYARNACEKEIVPALSKKTNVESNSHKKKRKVDVAIEKCTNFPHFNGKDGGVMEKMNKAMRNKTMTYASVKPKRMDDMEIERKAALDQYDSGFSCFTAACSRCRSHYMTLPKMVVEENGLMNKASLQLSDPRGRLWPVTVTHRIDGRVDLRGWGEFWKGNNLEAGDTCQFKFNEGLGNNVVYMEIFRAKQLVRPISQCLKPSRRLTCTPNEDAIQATESREGSGSVKIVDFSPIHPKADLKKEVIDENEGQQASNMRHLTPRSRLRYSLRSFENNITRLTFASDSRCSTQVKFTPKRGRNSTKNAEVFSPCQATQSTESDGYDSALQEESSHRVPISRNSFSTKYLGRWPVTTLITRVARDFRSDNPFYLVIMRSSYVNRPFKLNVPPYFARKYLKQDLLLTLRISDGRSWRVKFGSRARLGRGWMNFVKENHLKEGDVCIFELVNRRSIEMKVVIHRARC